jgi:hypothetical protein
MIVGLIGAVLLFVDTLSDAVTDVLDDFISLAFLAVGLVDSRRCALINGLYCILGDAIVIGGTDYHEAKARCTNETIDPCKESW